MGHATAVREGERTRVVEEGEIGTPGEACYHEASMARGSARGNVRAEGPPDPCPVAGVDAAAGVP